MLKINFHSTPEEDFFILSLGERSEKIGMFYYCIDSTFFKQDDSLSKGILNFVSMLINWKTKISALTEGKVDFLPFCYEDQYVSFIHTKHSVDDELLISMAYTTECTGVNPSQLYLVNFLEKSFSLFEPEYRVTKQQFKANIDDAITELLRNFYEEGSVRPPWM